MFWQYLAALAYFYFAQLMCLTYSYLEAFSMSITKKRVNSPINNCVHSQWPSACLKLNRHLFVSVLDIIHLSYIKNVSKM